MTVELARAEGDKAQAFWQREGERIRRTLSTPQCVRLHDNDIRNIDVRHMHNRFGWQAGGGTHCAGALYRTEDFMALPEADRCGTKALGQTVHIEHTVPVATLTRYIVGSDRIDPEDTVLWVLTHSVVTGVTDGPAGERHRMVRRGQATRSHALAPDQVDHDRPFRRYDPAGHSPIWDMVRGERIDPERFSFADHRHNIAVALRWAALDDWAERMVA
ncbi:hypothetical protein [uncultured Sphingomonas sp.]|uniref:hypothetical protein n=1 Tax=uncultured Sphingomonas sp. TaxID=158754 RepID=UPI0025F524F9|nr:hypothetical protein [uncultured Sphingomonas sp.]